MNIHESISIKVNHLYKISGWNFNRKTSILIMPFKNYSGNFELLRRSNLTLPNRTKPSWSRTQTEFRTKIEPKPNPNKTKTICLKNSKFPLCNLFFKFTYIYSETSCFFRFLWNRTEFCRTNLNGLFSLPDLDFTGPGLIGLTGLAKNQLF